MHFEILAEGFVVRNGESDVSVPYAAGPRCAALRNGDLLCSAMQTLKLGTNDFVPILYRSCDQGATWSSEGPVWPHLVGRWSIFASISRDAEGTLYLYGSRTPIETPGEPFWDDAFQGMKQNELFWSRSTDEGHTWSEPAVIPMAIPGSAEAPGALCVTQSGRWLAVYSPCNTFNPAERVDRAQVVLMFSDDVGRTWRHTSMLRFSEATSGGAEAWVTELGPGTLLGTGWHLDLSGVMEHPNAYAVSFDAGTTWQPTRSTGIRGQSTGLATLPDGRGLFIYNQRKHGEVGVWLAVVRPTADDFGVEINQIIWRAATVSQHGSSGEFAEWTDFSFGEPSITILPNGLLLATLWCSQPAGRGVRYVKLRLVN